MTQLLAQTANYAKNGYSYANHKAIDANHAFETFEMSAYVF